jgi:hypothetical protein
MTYELLVNRDGQSVVDRLGGAEARQIRARKTKAFRRARGIESAADLLRVILAVAWLYRLALSPASVR